MSAPTVAKWARRRRLIHPGRRVLARDIAHIDEAGVLLGSTSQTVLHHSTCPVMVVPSAHLGEGATAVHTEWERR